MNRFLLTVTALSVVGLTGGSARAASCSLQWPATASVNLVATVMKRDENPTYLHGSLDRVVLTIPGGGSATKWVSSSGSIHSFDVQLGGTTRPTGYVEVHVVKSASPSIVLKGRDGRSRTFAGTCSQSGLLHGTARDIDILIGLSPVRPIK